MAYSWIIGTRGRIRASVESIAAMPCHGGVEVLAMPCHAATPEPNDADAARPERPSRRTPGKEKKKTHRNNKHRPPYGEIFAAMMLCCAAGTRLFGFLAESRGPEDFARPLFVVASLFLLAPVVAPSNYVLALVAFLLFEGVVGCYFPALGTLKSKIVPDAQRSTIYNIFRVPLNVLVLLVLLSKLPTQTVFAVSALLLLSAAILQHMLFAAMRGHADVLDAHGVDAKDPLVSV
mmetsp:Transcript_22030/g.67594  ORF Transcript_22030/g.67594 Transcript_22030/m.67594 type:complete len:234 (-) Transcript_22030:53-754(-)